MDGTNHYVPTGTPVAEASTKIVQLAQISDKGTGKERSTSKPSFSRTFFNGCSAFMRRKVEPKKQDNIMRARVPERKSLRTSTVSTLSLSKMESSIDAAPYRWPHDGSFDPKTTALVIIDMQKDCKLYLVTFLSHLTAFDLDIRHSLLQLTPLVNVLPRQSPSSAYL